MIRSKVPLIDSDNILILSPHIDDGVLGCGGTIAKLTEFSDISIRYLVFSPSSAECDSEVLGTELLCAIKELGLDERNIEYLDFETRLFPENRQELTDVLYQIKEEDNIGVIFTPSRFDVHQDHQTVTNELLRVYKRMPTSIFGYEFVLNAYSFDTSVFCGLEEKYLKAKLKAIDCFKSQMHKSHFTLQFYESCARVIGPQIGTEFAEAFEAIRMII